MTPIYSIQTSGLLGPDMHVGGSTGPPQRIGAKLRIGGFGQWAKRFLLFLMFLPWILDIAVACYK